MPLPPSVARSPVLQHIRDVKYRAYAREDGLWDLEAELIDQKTQDIVLHGDRRWPANRPIHHMWIRLVLDTDLVVHGIDAVMDQHPLGHCPEATRALQSMVGSCLARGWRQAIADKLGGVSSCTHLRELLFSMATPAFQAISTQFQLGDSGQPPRHLGQCLGWDFQGPGVAQYYPQFVNWQPQKSTKKA